MGNENKRSEKGILKPNDNKDEKNVDIEENIIKLEDNKMNKNLEETVDFEYKSLEKNIGNNFKKDLEKFFDEFNEKMYTKNEIDELFEKKLDTLKNELFEKDKFFDEFSEKINNEIIKSRNVLERVINSKNIKEDLEEFSSKINDIIIDKIIKSKMEIEGVINSKNIKEDFLVFKEEFNEKMYTKNEINELFEKKLDTLKNELFEKDKFISEISKIKLENDKNKEIILEKNKEIMRLSNDLDKEKNKNIELIKENEQIETLTNINTEKTSYINLIENIISKTILDEIMELIEKDDLKDFFINLRFSDNRVENILNLYSILYTEQIYDRIQNNYSKRTNFLTETDITLFEKIAKFYNFKNIKSSFNIIYSEENFDKNKVYAYDDINKNYRKIAGYFSPTISYSNDNRIKFRGKVKGE